MKSQSKAVVPHSDTRVDLQKCIVLTGNEVYHFEFDDNLEERIWKRNSKKYFRDRSGRRIGPVNMADIPDIDQEELTSVKLRVRNTETVKLLNRLVAEAQKESREAEDNDPKGKKVEEESHEARESNREPNMESEMEDTEEPSQEGQPDTTRLTLVDYTTGKRYEKTEEGVWCYVRRPVERGGKARFQRKRLERHKAAELNRQLLQWAVIQKVNLHQGTPASFNKLWNARRTYYTLLNFTLSKQDPEGIVIFNRKNPIGTISLEWLDHFIARLVRFRNEYVLWTKREGNTEEES